MEESSSSPPQSESDQIATASAPGCVGVRWRLFVWVRPNDKFTWIQVMVYNVIMVYKW